ncbi:hypothetical protein RLIN73S_05423 [Rhodanobacter lindaniclasticus]
MPSKPIDHAKLDRIVAEAAARRRSSANWATASGR